MITTPQHNVSPVVVQFAPSQASLGELKGILSLVFSQQSSDVRQQLRGWVDSVSHIADEHEANFKSKVILAEKLLQPDFFSRSEVELVGLLKKAQSDRERVLGALICWYVHGNAKAKTPDERARFRGRDLNSILSDANQTIRTITDPVDDLQIPEPRLVRECLPRVEGANKTYIVTEAGLAAGLDVIEKLSSRS